MRVLVCGSRTWTKRGAIADALCDVEDAQGPLGHVLIHGAARGADTLAEQVAMSRFGWGILRYPADWSKYGNAAGYIRNKQMLEEGKPDIVLAFWDGKSRGTANMIQLAKAAGIEVKVFLSGR